MKLTSTRTSSLAFLLGILLILTIGIVAAGSIWVLRERAVGDWSSQVANLTTILAENTSQQMTTAVLALDSMTEQVQAYPNLDQHSLRSQMANHAIFNTLIEKTKSSPQIDVMAIVAANGDVINFSRSYPVPHINLAERDYFLAHMANPALGFFISQPVRNKGNGKWVFYMSHRLNDAHGEFIGLVLVGISTDYYTNFYRYVSLSGQASIILLRDDFTVLARWPTVENMIGKTNLTGTTHHIIHNLKLDKGVAIISAPRQSKDGKQSTRMGSAQRVKNFPLIVSYILDEEFYLADWRKTATVIAVVGVASMVALLFSFAILVKLLKRREADLHMTLALKQQAEAANQASKDSSDRMEAILSNAADAIITTDHNRLIESFNKAAEAIYGLSERDAIGQHIDIFTPPGATRFLQDATGDTLRDQGRVFMEVEQMRVDHSHFPAELLLSEFHVAGQRKIITIVRDITQRKRMERMKTDFVSTVSHELRTPLTAIRGALGLVAGGVAGAIPERAQTLVRMAHLSSERLTRLINDLLDVQKMEAGKIDFNFQILSLPRLIDESIEANQSFAHRLLIQIELDQAVPEVGIRVDADRFQQVMANLLSNACKYSPAGDMVRIRVSKATSERIRISVIDHGNGIPENFRSRIFEKFSQADSSDTKTKDGTGLGLSIAQAIVTQMDGVIDYQSTLGGGTIFFVEFPLYSIAECIDHVKL
jgi:PAS domain S-box-containing protein